MKKNSAKKSLIASLIILCLSFSMLVGTTFAWFTDSVTSGNNVIATGNLDVALDYWDGDRWKNVAGTNELFTGNFWEPGHTEIVYLRLANRGSLALKYRLGINVVSQTAGVNVAGDVFRLSDYIYMGVVEDVNGETNAYAENNAGRLAAINEVTESGTIGEGYTKNGSMLAGDDSVSYMAVVVYMPTTIGNEVNHNGVTVPSIDLGINLVATQYTNESDSFDFGYDIGAQYPGETVNEVVYDKTTMGGLYELLPTLEAGTTLVLPEGTYETSGTLIVADGVTIKAADGKTVVVRQNSAGQDDVFNCKGDASFINITIESNRKGYAIAGNTKNHDTDGDITIIGCTFRGIATDKNYGVYKNLYGDLTIANCTFDNYNNAICGVNCGGDSAVTIICSTFTNINGEAIGYVSASLPAEFEADVIANNTGLTAENVIGY